MKFLTAYHTDVGLRKKTNQDSLLIMQAETGVGPALLASVCDGMGGLAKGEVASAVMVRGLSAWFREKLPTLLAEGLTEDRLWASWDEMVHAAANRIDEYGASIHVEMGTTAAVLLVVGERYYILNVGDSRVYAITNQVNQLTKDQTYVQREIDMGRMTPEQAARDPQRNVLLQCIGVIKVIQPDYFSGRVAPGQSFLLCCDGFRHVISNQEIYQSLNPRTAADERTMQANLAQLTELNKRRREMDNITAVLIRTC